MDSISRIEKSCLLIKISYSRKEKESIEEEKAAQVHSYIEIHAHFEFLALPQCRQQTSQVGEGGEKQNDTQRLPSRCDRDNPTRGRFISCNIWVIPVDIGKREEPENE